METITLTTIDEFCLERNITSIDILKSDTEGNELQVLYGAKGILSENKIKYLVIEAGIFRDD